MKIPPPTRTWNLAALLLTASLIASAAHAQRCTGGLRVEGTVLDPTGAAIPNAAVAASKNITTTPDGAGHYVLPCLAPNTSHLIANAKGFSSRDLPLHARAGESVRLDFHLVIATVNTDVQVGDADDATSLDADHGIGTHTLNQKDIAQLADD